MIRPKTQFRWIYALYFLALLHFLATGLGGFIISCLYYFGATQTTMPVWEHWFDLGMMSSGYAVILLGIWHQLRKIRKPLQKNSGSGVDSGENGPGKGRTGEAGDTR